MSPREAQYWTARCAVHHLTTFGHYYLTTGFLSAGCLKCHFEDCPACPPAGAPYTQDLIADSKQEVSHA